MESDERAFSMWAQKEREDKSMTMESLRIEFESLERKHMRLSEECKHHGKYPLDGKRHSWAPCAHDSIGYRGMSGNTSCELINCPLMIEKN